MCVYVRIYMLMSNFYFNVKSYGSIRKASCSYEFDKRSYECTLYRNRIQLFVLNLTSIFNQILKLLIIYFPTFLT
jgi:hypothetical protein